MGVPCPCLPQRLIGDSDSAHAALLRRQTTMRREGRVMWYDNMEGAVRQTIIISEILDTRTRHLIQVPLQLPLAVAHCFCVEVHRS